MFKYTIRRQPGRGGSFDRRLLFSAHQTTLNALQRYLEDCTDHGYEHGPVDSKWDRAVYFSSSDEARVRLLLRGLREGARLPGRALGIDRASRLGRYSRYIEQPVDHVRYEKTDIGTLVNRAKYQSDLVAAEELAAITAEFALFHNTYRHSTAVLSVFSSSAVAWRIAETVADRLGVEAVRTSGPPGRVKVKDLGSVPGARRVKSTEISVPTLDDPRRILLIDDVWTSGETLASVAEACRRESGCAAVYGIVAAQAFRSVNRA